MHKHFLIVFIIVCSFVRIGVAQEPTLFPYSWEGIWQGDLEIFNTKGVAQTIPMELHILPTDSTHRFTWTLIYGTDKEAGKRPYELVIIDADKGW